MVVRQSGNSVALAIPFTGLLLLIAAIDYEVDHDGWSFLQWWVDRDGTEKLCVASLFLSIAFYGLEEAGVSVDSSLEPIVVAFVGISLAVVIAKWGTQLEKPGD